MQQQHHFKLSFSDSRRTLYSVDPDRHGNTHITTTADSFKAYSQFEFVAVIMQYEARHNAVSRITIIHQ